ncbi:MAG: FAD-dependent 5-carboxymethylaminomethyl-2-thiouridine(34) oxidoreductase MnmC [Alphaproteobacteria bacterium]|nr:FAD-dependent 5-carboxymethylaminomethyl-2-thiouridine(34) oxidoreductase MnmC [Alphaproteobacteria bacterium]HRW29846.1 FAD-dependent 5-carboxymethylaminomethyl-2-thiouridine(34) oxidoreductase MnmC [Emcibacteraceae bacterium]
MNKPWFKLPDPIKVNAHIAVIGGGIAGILLFYHLKNAGFRVTILEKNNHILSGASGNPVAILDPYISAGESPQKTFYDLAYQYALNYYGALNKDIFIPCPLIKFAEDITTLERYRKVAKRNSGEQQYLKENKLVFPNAGYIKPENIRRFFSSSDDFLFNVQVKSITKTKNDGWIIFDQDEKPLLEVDAVIFANSYNYPDIAQVVHNPLKKLSGQISYIKSDYNENTILNAAGYLTPPIISNGNKFNICGASFEKNISLKISQKAHEENLRKAPFTFKEIEVIGGRRGIRSMTDDHFPLCGPVPDHTKYMTSYDNIHHGNKYEVYPDAPLHKNLFVLAGLGSKGFVSAPLLAKYLTSMLSAEPLPFDQKICHLLHPARFIIRELSKK